MSLHGIINLHKPAGITSAQSLYRVRSICGQRKSGHAGALDRLATGVLVLCLGRATKLVESIMDQPKVYRTTARLDVTSMSYDCGEPLVEVEVRNEPSIDDIRDLLDSFVGEIEQVPPTISAIKVGGVPAHRRTRRNQNFELQPRPVRIYWTHLHAYDWPMLDFEICCGRGTYVRALVRDIGARLETGGCLTSLTRTSVGPFALTDAWTLEALADAADPEKYLFDLERSRAVLEPANATIPAAPD